MSFNRMNWQIALGWIMLMGVVATLFLTWQKSQHSEPPRNSAKQGSGIQRSYDPRGKAFKIAARDRKARSKPEIDSAASNRLQNHLAAGELNAIEEELAALAENHKLIGVSEILKKWCREGSLELAQWSLVFSQGSDPELNLALCAEALSNPSEVIRDIAGAQLEGSSDIRFSDTASARAWLAARLSP